MSLYNHLRTDQNIGLMPSECPQNLRMSILPFCRIRIHPQDPCLRKCFFYNFLYLLCTRPKASDKRGAAFRAGPHSQCLIATIMADQPAAPMQRKRHITVRAAHYLAARPAGYKSGIPAPVQKQHRLPVLLQHLRQLFL